MILMLCLININKKVYAQKDTTAVDKDTSAIVVMMEVPDTAKVARDSINIEDIHRQDSPEESGFLITTPDGKSQLRIRGSVRLNGALDLNGLQNKDLFSTFEIPVGEANRTEPRFFMSANQTRFGIEATRETPIGEAFMRIEGDFRVPPDLFRLRHAYGTLGYFLAGQTWSTFGDPASIPWTVDLDGPNSSVSERTVQLRYTRVVSDNFRWVLAVESPTPDINKPDTLKLEPVFQSFPDVAGRLKRQGEWGHMQISAIIRSITVRNIAGEQQELIGFGGLLSGEMEFDGENELMFQAVYGNAISKFIGSLTGRGLDAIFNPNTNEFETVTSMGGFVSYGHTWKPDLYSYFTFGLTNVVNKDYQPDDAFSISQYVSGNVFWEAATGTRLGVEYSWGRRVNKNGNYGTANRVSFIIYYDF
jgi:hypothetical protein